MGVQQKLQCNTKFNMQTLSIIFLTCSVLAAVHCMPNNGYETRNFDNGRRDISGQAQNRRTLPERAGGHGIHTRPYNGERNTRPYNGERNTRPYNGKRNTRPYNGERNTRPYNGKRNTRPYN